MAQHVWQLSYPAGVPREIDPDAFRSLVDLFEQSVAAFPERPAFRNFGATLSYRDVDRLSRQFAAYLHHEAGIRPGDRVALMIPNLLQYPVVLFGALRIGAVVVCTNPLYTGRELEHQMRDSGARAIVILENFAHVLAEVIERTRLETVIVTAVGDLLAAPKSWITNFAIRYIKRLVPPYRFASSVKFMRCLANRSSPPEVALAGEDLAFLQYTGGTTGVAKGAMLTHRNLIANVEQSVVWLRPFFGDRAETVVTALPLYHVFAMTANCLTFVRLGGLNHLITNPRDLPGFVRELEKMEFTAITGVNTLFNALLNTPGFREVDFTHLKISLGGGMSVQHAVAESWHATTGCVLLEAYGLTETSPAVCINPVNASRFSASIGLPLPSTEVAIRDQGGNALEVGEVGELCVRGPQVMRGYWQRPDETDKVIDPDGWLHTGDLATIDDAGFVRIVDRMKDMIVVSGFNVYPNEVEDVVATHPGVLEVGAVGIPDARSGEAVKIIVVRRDAGLSEEALRRHCREQLTGYKCPQVVVFADELPKSNIGKILRRELRERTDRGTQH